MTDELSIFNASGPIYRHWSCVNDDVMGGVSQSFANVHVPSKKLLWAGNVSLENNGGFASVRHSFPSLDLGSYTGISLLLTGDGKTYKLNLANDLSSGSPRYQARFATYGQLQLVYVPFRCLSASVRGTKVEATFDPSNLQMLGFLIADQQDGLFGLSVQNISAYV